MSLVDYSFSDDEDAEESISDDCNGPTFAKKRCLDGSKTGEDDRLNTEITGRIRTFAHERGNWASFIYVPIPFSDSLRELQSRIAKNFENDSSVQLHFIESIHISLTRTVVLQHHWIDEFKKSVRQSTIDCKRFTIGLNMLNVYCNDDETTTFVAIAVPDIYCAPLNALVERFDSCLAEFKLPAFYKDPSFHVSVLWCVGNKKAKILMEMKKLEKMLLESIEDDCEDYQIDVNRVECKIGNKIFNYPLLS